MSTTKLERDELAMEHQIQNARRSLILRGRLVWSDTGRKPRKAREDKP